MERIVFGLLAALMIVLGALAGNYYTTLTTSKPYCTMLGERNEQSPKLTNILRYHGCTIVYNADHQPDGYAIDLSNPGSVTAYYVSLNIHDDAGLNAIMGQAHYVLNPQTWGWEAE